MKHYKRAYSKSNDRTQKIDMSFRLAECARKIGNYRQAESYYKRTIKMRYDDPIAIYYLGMMQRNIGKYQDAVESFQLYMEKVLSIFGGIIDRSCAGIGKLRINRSKCLKWLPTPQ